MSGMGHDAREPRVVQIGELVVIGRHLYRLEPGSPTSYGGPTVRLREVGRA